MRYFTATRILKNHLRVKEETCIHYNMENNTSYLEESARTLIYTRLTSSWCMQIHFEPMSRFATEIWDTLWRMQKGLLLSHSAATGEAIHFRKNDPRWTLTDINIAAKAKPWFIFAYVNQTGSAWSQSVFSVKSRVEQTRTEDRDAGNLLQRLVLDQAEGGLVVQHSLDKLSLCYSLWREKKEERKEVCSAHGMKQSWNESVKQTHCDDYFSWQWRYSPPH